MGGKFLTTSYYSRMTGYCFPHHFLETLQGNKVLVEG